MNITKLDRRHKGHEQFKYYVSPGYVQGSTLITTLLDWRDWSWETWGPSAERDYVRSNQNVWAWFFEPTNHVYRIYLKSEKELTWFKLRWS